MVYLFSFIGIMESAAIAYQLEDYQAFQFEKFNHEEFIDELNSFLF